MQNLAERRGVLYTRANIGKVSVGYSRRSQPCYDFLSFVEGGCSTGYGKVGGGQHLIVCSVFGQWLKIMHCADVMIATELKVNTQLFLDLIKSSLGPEIGCKS